MSNNGLIDPKPGFSLACCFSGPVQCPAKAPVAYKFKNYCSYSIHTKVKQYSLESRALAEQCGCGWLPQQPFVQKRILTSLQTSWHPHSRKRPSILTSSIQIVAVSFAGPGFGD